MARSPFGAILGPEAPLIALGSVVGVAFAPLARLDAQERKVLNRRERDARGV